MRSGDHPGYGDFRICGGERFLCWPEIHRLHPKHRHHVQGGGANLFDISDYTQNTIGGGAFIGYDFYPVYQVPVRAEIEYAIRTNSMTSWDDKFGTGADLQGEWGLQTLFLNAYWDFHNSTNFTPYIGAGVGMAFINSKYEVEMDGWSDSVQETNTVFA